MGVGEGGESLRVLGRRLPYPLSAAHDNGVFPSLSFKPEKQQEKAARKSSLTLLMEQGRGVLLSYLASFPTPSRPCWSCGGPSHKWLILIFIRITTVPVDTIAGIDHTRLLTVGGDMRDNSRRIEVLRLELEGGGVRRPPPVRQALFYE